MSFLESNSILLHELIVYGNNKLDTNSLSNAKKEIEWFLEDQFSISFYDIKFNKNQRLNKTEIDLFLKFIERRLAGEPFQYIINSANFYGYDFFVNKKTLIPRPETELIINIAKQYNTFNKALDIGTGSGNLAITLAMENIVNEVDAIDISSEAINVAINNAKTYSLNNIVFYQHDFLSKPIKCKYDLIVSNPPYISIDDYQKLDNHIKHYEPQGALTDSHNGLSFYIFFAKNLGKMLIPGGKIILEIGYEETKPDIDKLFLKEGFKCIWHKDLNDNYRVVEIFFE
jgi:release factor glutamine methyltransferase